MSRNFRIFFLTIFSLGSSILATESPFSYEEYNLLIPTTKKNYQFLESHDKTKLAYYPFIANENTINAVVIIYHGGGAYATPAYQWIAEKLQQNGISTYCFDLRGHGNSEGPRGDAPSAEAVFDDIKQTIAWMQSRHPNKKIYLVGHSSGAGLLINYHHNRRDKRIAGYIALAPFLGPKAPTNQHVGKDAKSFVKNVRTWVFIVNTILPVSWFAHFNAVFLITQKSF